MFIKSSSVSWTKYDDILKRINFTLESSQGQGTLSGETLSGESDEFFLKWKIVSADENFARQSFAQLGIVCANRIKIPCNGGWLATVKILIDKSRVTFDSQWLPSRWTLRKVWSAIEARSFLGIEQGVLNNQPLPQWLPAAWSLIQYQGIVCGDQGNFLVATCKPTSVSAKRSGFYGASDVMFS